MKTNAWFKLAMVSLTGMIISFVILWGVGQFNQYKYNNSYMNNMQNGMNMPGMNMQSGMKMHGGMGMSGMNMQGGMSMPSMNMQGGMGMSGMNMQGSSGMSGGMGMMGMMDGM